MILFSCRCAKKKNTLKMIDRASAIFSVEKICVPLQVKVQDFFKSVNKKRCVKELLENSSTLSNNFYETVARKIIQIKSTLVSICPDIRAQRIKSHIPSFKAIVGLFFSTSKILMCIFSAVDFFFFQAYMYIYFFHLNSKQEYFNRSNWNDHEENKILTSCSCCRHPVTEGYNVSYL